MDMEKISFMMGTEWEDLLPVLWLLETSSQAIAKAGLKLTMQLKLDSNSQLSSCLSFLGFEITGTSQYVLH